MNEHDGGGARSKPGRLEFERAIRRSDLPPPSRHLALTIATWADMDSGVIADRFQPSLSTLAEATGLNRATVQRHLDRLEADGWIVRDRPDQKKARVEHARTHYSLELPPGARRTGRLGAESAQPLGAESTQGKAHSAPRARRTEHPKSPYESHESLSLAERVVRDSDVVADEERETFISWLKDKHQIRGPGWWKTVTTSDLAEHAADWRAEQTTAAPSLLPCCERCRAENPAAEHNVRWRKRAGQPCPDCHPDTRRSEAS